MNYLAHCLLAQPSPESLIGSLAPDFSRPHDYAPQSPTLQAAMREHYAIDTFTDAHPLFLQSRARFKPRFRHYAGAITDVVYDHLLSLRWDRYESRALPDFAHNVYVTLNAHVELCPEALRETLPRMREQNWLASYGEIDGVSLALQRISRRLQSKPDFSAVASIVETERAELLNEFDAFFPQLQAHVAALRT